MTTLTEAATTDELSVVNACLLTLGEAPLDTLQDDHPLVPGARALLRQRSRQIQTQGWWFNTETRTLLPNTDTEVVLPQNTIKVEVPSALDRYVQRGQKLFDAATGTSLGLPAVECKLTLFLDFAELPEIARQYVGAVTTYQFAANAAGDQAKLEVLQVDVAMTRSEFMRQHLLLIKPNLLNTRTNQLHRALIRTNRRTYF